MKDYTKNLYYRLAVLICGFASMAYLFLMNPPRDRRDNVYETKEFNHKQFGNVHFKDVSAELGIDFQQIKTTGPLRAHDGDLLVIAFSPSVSVIDINNDGYMDIFVTTARSRSNLLFINHKGTSFTEEAAQYGLSDLNQKDDPSYAFWGDFNDDGLLDLVYARYGCHGFFTGTKNNKLADHSEWFNGYCSNPNGLNAADFYKRGKLDLIFANFLAAPGESDSSNDLWMTNTRYDNKSGGKNHLLKNEGSGFSVEKRAHFLTRSYSHNAGIADINMDGLPDIFFSNDYAHDEMFLNNGEGRFSDLTDQYIPKVLHGLSGMNTEFFDYDSDGMIDLYVTNIFKPPFNRHFNLLWKKSEDNTYKNVSNDLGVAKCGFSWGAKFADINNDGEADLFVMNGRSRSNNLVKYGEGKSMWYERNEVSQIPRFIRKLYKPHDTIKGRYISAFERKCLFIQKDGKFFDIAEDAGFDDREENRTLALIDYDNDGLMDAISAGPISKLKVLHNTTKTESDFHWIGFSFKDKRGNSVHHGLKIKFLLSNGKKIVRELYPANGYKGFNDPRLHIGLGKAQISGPIEVFWPFSRVTQIIKNVQPDQYNLVTEK
ncbi:MAG: CRTAC1 family protein [Bacteriovorax sp.]|jgi:hypothetical protein